MVINVLDHVPRCYTYEDGRLIADQIARALRHGEPAIVSFAGVDAVPSSFVNAAFVGLLAEFPLAQIKRLVQVRNSTRQINSLIKERLEKEAALLQAA